MAIEQLRALETQLAVMITPQELEEVGGARPRPRPSRDPTAAAKPQLIIRKKKCRSIPPLVQRLDAPLR